MTAAAYSRLTATGTHAALFYEQDHELLPALFASVRGGIEDGETAIVIATRGHLRSLEQTLVEHGFDPDDLRTTGRLVSRDAAELLEAVCPGGGPNESVFDAVAGGLVRSCLAAGRSVCIYGEMVSVLWATGERRRALRLEELWVGLGRRLDFSLLCGYRVGSTEGNGPSEAGSDICAIHTDVFGRVPVDWLPAEIPQHQATQSFTASVGSPSAARAFAVGAARSWKLSSGDEGVVDDLAFVVAELATNAVVHARTPFTLRIARLATSLRVSVEDHSDQSPRIGPLAPRSETGRGLALVARLADRWDYGKTASGKVVWADLRVHEEQST